MKKVYNPRPRCPTTMMRRLHQRPIRGQVALGASKPAAFVRPHKPVRTKDGRSALLTAIGLGHTDIAWACR